MRVALVHEADFPVRGYGGTERVVWWLLKGLAERGVDVCLVAKEGATNPYGKSIPMSAFNERMVDLVHYFNTPSQHPIRPYLVTIGGNGRAGETFLPNTVFVSENHAKRHGAIAFVHNGLDPEEYVFRESKGTDLSFLAKASWKVKNVSGAIRLARKSRRKIQILGGTRFLLKNWRGVHWRGTVTGAEKASILSDSSGLLFPVLWNEPFGIAVIEALVSGTPVLATPFGSLPELIPGHVGKLCSTEAAFLDGIEHLHEFKPRDCREWVLENFTYRQMARKYLKYYELVLAGERLNPGVPRTTREQGQMLDFPAKEH